jgi:hypothetical protein
MFCQVEVDMINPNMPNIPGIGAMTDTLDFVKNLWGSMGIPGMGGPGMNVGGVNMPAMMMPTFSVDDINKKITDLKAVESWLNLNMSMLRSTIQALEVQAATLTALQTMGQSFGAAMQPGTTGAAAGQGGNGASAAEETTRTGNGSDGAGKTHAAPEPTSKEESDAAALTAPFVNAAAWWNMLQDQFRQAVGQAMNEVPGAAEAGGGAKPKAKPKAKTASATSASGTTRKRKTTK